MEFILGRIQRRNASVRPPSTGINVQSCSAPPDRPGTESPRRSPSGRSADASASAWHRSRPADRAVHRRSPMPQTGSRTSSAKRSRGRAGNIVDPFTTVAGLIPFTRTSGASPIASSRTRWLKRRLAHVVSLAAALGNHRIGRAGEHHVDRQALFLEGLRGFVGQQIIRRDVDIERQRPLRVA